MNERINRFLGLALLFFIPSCISNINVMDGSLETIVLEKNTLKRDTKWKGNIKVNGLITVPKDITLTIAPGSKILFASVDEDKDGINDSGLLVNGRLIAKGKSDKLITFISADENEPGSWGEIRFEDANPSLMSHCLIKYAYWGVHAHFSPLTIESCVFENCEGGMRFRSGPIEIRNCLFEKNEIGIRFLYSNPVLDRNTIRYNRAGIFVREGAKRPRINNNNIYENSDFNIKFGEAQKFDIDFTQNYWGTLDKNLIDLKIFDKKDIDYLGEVIYEPAAVSYIE